ncbi:DUF3987 domain-containing protein [Burkholderia sp. BCC1977]|uniref:DUF3987 domain-containing protein n=1 Tax=Burkholderia sp. BCC1977 TaxID=2817440 RepID=UPI002ABD8E81|nr:DUF3987 domain-containing protein [Burkholderia sp. BCC1977]
MSNGITADQGPHGIHNSFSPRAGGDELQYRLPSVQGAYPIDSFPEIVRKAVTDVDAELGGGVELGASAALAVVSLVCQEFVNVQRPKLPPSACSLFLITVAGTGAGKSEIQGRFMSAVEQFEREEEARAQSVSDDYQDLSGRDRLSQLQTLRAEREEVLASYDDLHGQDEKLEKKEKASFREVPHLRRNVGTSRAEREREWLQSTQQVRMERQALKPRLSELKKNLAEIDREISSLLGNAARRLVYGRGSFAGFRNGLQDKCRSAGIISAEAGGILNSQMVTRNMDAWNDLWGTEFFRETYDKREYVIDAPRLTVALMLQPKQFKKFVDAYGENALDNGFFSRTLLLEVPRQSPRPAGGTDEPINSIPSLEKFHGRVREILDQDFPWIAERLVLRLTGKARRYWEGYYNELNAALDRGQFDPEMAGFVRKLPEQAARVAALFHYFEHYPITTIHRVDQSTGRVTLANNEIPMETVRAAIGLCDWYMAEFRKLVVSHQLPEEFTSWVYSAQVRTSADRIYQTIQRNYRKYEARQQSSCIRLSYRDVQNGNRTIKNRADILAALHCLASEQKVYLGSGPNGGVFVCFNPFHTYSCGRCTYPVAAQSSLTTTLHETQGMHSGNESNEHETVTQGGGDEWLSQRDDASERSLLDEIAAQNPHLFSENGTQSVMDEGEHGPASSLQPEVPKSSGEIKSIEMDDVADFRWAEMRRQIQGGHSELGTSAPKEDEGSTGEALD